MFRTKGKHCLRCYSIQLLGQVAESANVCKEYPPPSLINWLRKKFLSMKNWRFLRGTNTVLSKWRLPHTIPPQFPNYEKLFRKNANDFWTLPPLCAIVPIPYLYDDGRTFCINLWSHSGPHTNPYTCVNSLNALPGNDKPIYLDL